MVYQCLQGVVNMKNTKAQATIEYTFCMVVIALLIFGLIKIFHWTGLDYAEHSWEREQNLPIVTDEEGGVIKDKPIRTKRMNAFTRTF